MELEIVLVNGVLSSLDLCGHLRLQARRGLFLLGGYKLSAFCTQCVQFLLLRLYLRFQFFEPLRGLLLNRLQTSFSVPQTNVCRDLVGQVGFDHVPLGAVWETDQVEFPFVTYESHLLTSLEDSKDCGLQARACAHSYLIIALYIERFSQNRGRI